MSMIRDDASDGNLMKREEKRNGREFRKSIV